MRYQNMLSKGRIGKLELKNRVVLPPMGTNFASYTNEASDEIIRYYEERARGGCGLIITEITRIDDETGVGVPNQLAAINGKQIARLEKLADAVHRHDSKIFLQLHHPGREVGSKLLGGKQPIAPSPIACGVIGEVPREMTTAECDAMVKKFIGGAVIAKMAGCDGVELHGAHGYLINQFLSPYTNKRTDKYGGDFFNRMRFITNIIVGIKAMCGPDFPICVRLSIDEFIPGGLKVEDGVKIARYLEGQEVAAINVSAGTYESGYSVIEPHCLPEGWKSHLAKAVKAAVKIPVIAVNNIKHAEFAEKLLEDGTCDFVAVGRGQLADAQWVNKAKCGQETLTRKCIGCMHCFRIINMSRAVQCTLNPHLGREVLFNEDTLKTNGDGRAVAVVGGGPGGMQAAYILQKRGFKVTLFDKADKLGGQMNQADKPPHKTLITEFIATQVAELESVGVEVRLNTPATVDAVKALNPYGVIMAVGGSPIVPKLPGVDGKNVCTSEDILTGKVSLKGKNVAVIGGGVTGLETAELLSADNKVSVIEMMGDVGTTLYASVKGLLMKRLAEAKVEILTNHSLSAIAEGEITLMHTQAAVESKKPVDAVVLAMGVRPNRAIVEEFEAAFDKITAVGDARQVGQMADAIREANDKAFVF